MTTAAIYARISDDRKEQAGVDRQEHLCRQLAQQHGFDVADVYVDNSISAYHHTDRPAFIRLVAAVKARAVDVVLAFAPDRISRRVEEYALFKAVLADAGVRLIYVNGGELTLDDPNSDLISTMLSGVAQWESSIKSVRVTAASKQRALRGNPPGGARRFGYTVNGRDVVPDEAAALKTVIERILSGASIRSQAKWLNDQGLYTPSRKAKDGREKGLNPWQTSSLRTCIERPALAGIVTYKGVEYRDVVAQWPPIITVEEHDAVVALLADPSRRTNRGKWTQYLGTGLYLCGADGCGAHMSTTIQNRPGGNVRLYRCVYAGDTLKKTRHGSHVARRLDRVDDVVTAAVVGRLAAGDVQRRLADAQGADVAGLVAERDQIRARKAALSSALADTTVDLSQVIEANAALDSRLTHLNEELARHDSSGVLDMVGSIVDPAVWWSEANIEQKRAVVDALMTVTIMPTTAGTRFNPDDIAIEWKV